MNTTELLEKAVSAGASDIFVVAGRPVSMRIHGDIRMEDNTRLLPDDTRRIIEQIYELAGHRDIGILEDTGDDDFSFAVPGLSRFRVSAFKQRGSLSVVIRIISFTLPDPAFCRFLQRNGTGHRTCRKREIHYPRVHHRPYQ